MATYNIVPAAELIEHAMRYYHEGWGYILNTSGQIWTQAAQNARAKTDEQVAKYGQQWVGKRVIDCSGLWMLAMKECGSYMYHGYVPRVEYDVGQVLHRQRDAQERRPV